MSLPLTPDQIEPVATERDLTQERLANVLRQVPAFVAVLHGPDHVFEVANPAYLKLINHRQAVGQPVREVLPELEQQGFIRLLDQVFRTGEPYVGREQPIMLRHTPDSEPEERFLNFVYQPNADTAGDVVGVIVHGVDVTEQVLARRTAEQQTEQLQEQATQLEAAQGDLEAANQRLAVAREEAENARSWLEAVIHQMPSGVVIANAPDGELILANQQMEQIWPPAPAGEPLSGWERFRAIHSDGTPYSAGEWPVKRALQGEFTMNEEITILRPDGSRGIISANSAPIRDRAGSVVAAVAVFDDVTQRWQRENAQAFLVEAARILASSLDYQETLRAVARLAVPRIGDWCSVDVVEEGVPQRLAVVHTDPALERMAEEVARLWPTSPDLAVGVPKVLRTGEAELYSEVTDEVLRAAGQSEEHLAKLRELQIRSAMVVPMVARGRILGAITFVSADPRRRYGADDMWVAEKLASRGAMAIDNSLLFRQAERSRDDAEIAQRRAEDARRVAESANHAKSEFLATMSHEMRTPLNAVTGYTELLEMGIAGPLTDQQREQLGRIRKSTDHLLMLINDLLDLARIESGRVEVQQEKRVAVDTAEAAVALVGPQAAEREIDLAVECASDEAIYVGDQDRVRQILVNLVSNAVKFTRPGGRVTVTCGAAEGEPPEVLAAEPGPWTYFRVEDTGVGIEPEQIDRIFRPFEQVQGGYTREAGGAGLGLSISRQLALLMGGELTGESRPGVGSVFTLWLPREEPPSLPALDRLGSSDGDGLAAVGQALLAEVDEILQAYVGRLREDPLLPRAADLAEGVLKDHHSSLLSDFAAALLVSDAPRENQVRLLQDGSQIQRLLAELHGRQRAQLGWTERALEREFEIWREELRRALRGKKELHRGGSVLRDGIAIIDQLMDRALRISLRAFRATAAGMGAAGDHGS